MEKSWRNSIFFVFGMSVLLSVRANAMEDYVAGDDYRKQCRRWQRVEQVGLCCCYAGLPLCLCALMTTEVTPGCLACTLFSSLAAGGASFLNKQDEPCTSVRSARDVLCCATSKDVSALSEGEMLGHERRIAGALAFYGHMASRPECAAYGDAIARERQQCERLRKRMADERWDREKRFIDTMNSCVMD